MIFHTTRECVGGARVVYSLTKSIIFFEEKNDQKPILNERFTN